MEHGAVAERLGAEWVLADRLQHPAERRVHHPKQHQEGRRDDDQHQIIAS